MSQCRKGIDMELKQLEYFIAVADELSFTKAAQKLFITQPPLSRQIQQLEEEIDAKLFYRKSRSIELTEAGLFFYKHAKNILQISEEAKLMTRRIGSQKKEFKLGFVGSTLFGYLPQIICGIRLAHPEFKILIEEMGTPTQIDALKSGVIEVGFGRMPIEDPTITNIVLRREPLVVATPLNHPFSQRDTPIKLSELIEETIILSRVKDRSPSYSTLIIEAFKQRRLPLPTMREEGDLQFALGLVAAGEGISIVPTSYQKIKFNVIYHHLEDPTLAAAIIMNFRKDDHSLLIESLLKIIYGLYENDGIYYEKSTLLTECSI
ncbi:LysR family transcriptional regulator [Ignatzschineria cameli]|uniref:LysR family transcriptional regulator n=1 Tax=Ignatzschineria cameli TaxID=2182793 RepID=A0A2U2ATZ3_9GAMM|nr:LysR family transcriptional regulator [Ignatzschineria cameli]PWD88155.1 LysR family transcriptional regulator [Ignatzschineria cameli]PWD91185.1 LysR family transcriptional regulator [Ignatzschineria cameli]PWD92826.1 LysR family transcriptional regulator [Ignatzschineria cameli]PWD93847.1 LysR family transcriptional regulator [Ignatzschineria cameli]